MKKFHIKKNDQVVVITGENKGSEGKVLEMHTKTSRALVEGVNMIKRHTKPNTQFPDGGIIEKEAPIHVSNLKLVEAKAGTAKNSSK
ncbi:MAG: large subunit ribosomal protein L24 [Bacteroidia bacterium]|jgi:large subunit ribosomal protein L24